MSPDAAAWVRDHVLTPTYRANTVDPARCPCQWGPSGHCLVGRHDRCPRTQGWERPAPSPDTWITDAQGMVAHAPASPPPCGGPAPPAGGCARAPATPPWPPCSRCRASPARSARAWSCRSRRPTGSAATNPNSRLCPACPDHRPGPPRGGDGAGRHPNPRTRRTVDDLRDLRPTAYACQQMANLAERFNRAIEIADVVAIVNPDGYIGTSTRKKAERARSLGKRIVWMVKP